MILHSDRKTAVTLIDEAHSAGARKWRACEELEISVRTYQRWVMGGDVNADQRPLAERPAPQNKLTLRRYITLHQLMWALSDKAVGFGIARC